MTDEQINAAIAKACGWRKEDGVYMWTANGIDWTNWTLWDWCNDLNAMHEAEKTLKTMALNEYIGQLFDLCYEATIATARQRAEAFLRTLGKWKEEAK
jgi:hypothetical protein